MASRIHFAIFVMAAGLTAIFGEQQCRYEFIVPAGNGMSCDTPDVGRIDSELTIARERANSVAATLGAEITKMQSATAAVQQEMKTLSQDLGQLKTDLGKVNNGGQNLAEVERAIHQINETVNSDYKFLSKKIMDASASLQMQLSRQMDVISVLAAEESSQRQLLDKQTITLSDLQSLSQSVQGFQNEVNLLKSNAEKNDIRMANIENELRGVGERIQKSEEMVDRQISTVKSKIDGLQSTLLGFDLSAIQGDIAALKQNTELLGTTLQNQSKLLEGFDPVRLQNSMVVLTVDLDKQREVVGDIQNRTMASSPAIISQKLSELSDTLDKDREATKSMWDGLWSRLNSATRIIEALSRDVAQLKTRDKNNEHPRKA